MKSLNCIFRPSTVQRTARQLQRCSSRASAAPPPTQRCPLASSSSRSGLRPFSNTARQRSRQAADDPAFTSIVDNPPELVRTNRRHGPGLILLAIMPITAFCLGTWQVYRLQWKNDLVAKCEDRLVRDPLPLPPRIDPAAIPDFDYRRVYTTGRFRHDEEMLIGPRIHDGQQGYMVVTPLETTADDGRKSKILVNRGWIPKKFKLQKDRPAEALPAGDVKVEGLLREPWKKNRFTPDNRPDIGEFYFPDVAQMASLTGSQPVWIEATMEPDILQVYDMIAKGIPIGRAPEVNLRNNHAQYIFTWYSLAVATTVMFWLVVKKPPTDITKRVRMNKSW
ncbi:uncharacterized protein E0L32_005655 [Thyridium curvatum]|uniref:SURF1-like protein n=1 Tax=Thyridium curvatum TaxID=1093900 RepID=A0A507AT17_9PEZI|nr:uncharacterized protein E0L32_005655 [Thyridium curvatum]TPX13955.1 hypothetical protein E0L32_005655 [Thyridium curvatum]